MEGDDLGRDGSPSAPDDRHARGRDTLSRPGSQRRPFTGLRDRPPAERYDVVVIGGGISGLLVGLMLARQGVSVLLVEQHYMVGGYCSTFRRAHYTFDAASHFYPLLGNPETLTGRLLRELGIETGWIPMDPVDTFHLPDGTRFTVPADFDQYLERVWAAFPHEREGLDAFFAAVREAYLLGLLEYFRGRPTARLDPFRDLTLKEALDRHFRDERLKLVLTADCPHWGSPPSRTSFVFDSMLRLSYFLGNYYPQGGSQAFPDEIARRFEEEGGDLAVSTAARRVLVENGRAAGVEVERLRGGRSGETHRVRAETVVAAGDLRHLVRDLLPDEALPAAYRRSVDEMRPSYACFLSHIGLAGVDPKVLDEAQGYYWNEWDPDRVGHNGLRCKVFVPTQYEPRMAPPGGQIVILQKVIAPDLQEAVSWPADKAGIEDYVFRHLESVVPGIGEHVVTRTSASAATSERFTWNQEGAMLGWEMAPDQLGADRPGVETPIPGLYLTGHWTRPGGGITPVIVSAMRVAERVAGESRREPPELAALEGE